LDLDPKMWVVLRFTLQGESLLEEVGRELLDIPYI
jgi:hypothetical protein